MGMIAQVDSRVQPDEKTDTTNHKRKQETQSVDQNRQVNVQTGNPIDLKIENLAGGHLR